MTACVFFFPMKEKALRAWMHTACIRKMAADAAALRRECTLSIGKTTFFMYMRQKKRNEESFKFAPQNSKRHNI